MKKTMVYILTLLMLVGLLSGCGAEKGNAGDDAPRVTTTPDINGAIDGDDESVIPDKDDMLPDVDDGIVNDRDGILTEDDNSGANDDGIVDDDAKADVEGQTSRSARRSSSGVR